MEATDGGGPRRLSSAGTAIGQASDSSAEDSQALVLGRRIGESRLGSDSTERELRLPGRGPSLADGPSVSVIVPTLNEARNLPLVFQGLPHGLHEVIIVDGFSSDDTVEVARFLRPDAIILMQERPGKGEALRCGFEAASGEIIVMLDADGSADPAEIPAFVRALLDGADFAKGTRFGPGAGSADLTGLRQVGNRGLNSVVNILFGTDYSDLCYGYNAFWRRCLPAMNVDCTGFEVETLINIRIARAGLQIREVPSFERSRVHGQSNLRTFRDGGRVLRTILRERLRRAPRPHPVEVLAEPFAIQGMQVSGSGQTD